jgi:hypothetical protein
MRKRWKWDPIPFGVAWLVGGGIGSVTLAVATPGHRLSTATAIALAVWTGPVFIGVAVLFLGGGCVALWKARPRRVVESVHEDLREVWKPHA